MQRNARVCNVQRRPTNARVSPPRGSRCTLRVQYTLKHAHAAPTHPTRAHTAQSAQAAPRAGDHSGRRRTRSQACGPSWCLTRHTTSSGSCRRGNRCTASRMPQWPHRPQKRRPKGPMAAARGGVRLCTCTRLAGRDCVGATSQGVVWRGEWATDSIANFRRQRQTTDKRQRGA